MAVILKRISTGFADTCKLIVGFYCDYETSSHTTSCSKLLYAGVWKDLRTANSITPARPVLSFPTPTACIYSKDPVSASIHICLSISIHTLAEDLP